MATPDFLKADLAEMVAARPAYDQAQAMYEGTTPEVFASRRLRALLGNAGKAFRVNYARTPVDALLEKTQIQGIQGTTDLELVELAWKENELGLEAKDIHRLAYEFGDAYLIGARDDDLLCGASLYSHDPRNVRVFYDPNRRRVKHHAIHHWTERGSGDGEDGNGLTRGKLWWRVNVYWPDGLEQLVSQSPLDELTRARGSVFGDSTSGDPILVPYAPEPWIESDTPGLIPVFHFRVSRPYGRPEHADAYGPQNMLNKFNITMMSSVDYAGFPQRYVATDAALTNSAPDAFSEEPGVSTSDTGLSEDSDMEAGPGSTWLLSGTNIAVGEFAVAQTRNFLDGIESLVKQMAAITDTPLHYFDRSGQMPSGESFRRSEQPLIDKLADRQAQFGVTWAEVFAYVAEVNGRTTDAMPAWSPGSGITLDKDSWETGEVQIRTGVPRRVVWVERGYSSDQADEWEGQAPDPATPAAPTADPAEPAVPDAQSGPAITPAPAVV